MALARKTSQLVVIFRPLIAGVGLYLLLASSALGQASFHLDNRNSGSGVNAPVFNAQGVALSGSAYLAELWGGADSNSLTPLVLVYQGDIRLIIPFRTDVPGYFSSGRSDLCVTSVMSHTYAWLQVHAWQANLGATYEQVVALGIGGYGSSSLFYARGNDPFLGGVPEIPAPLIGLQSFSLLPVVPEPGTWALALLGLACFTSWRWLGKRSNSS
jgi:hypothetical protein